MNTVTAPAITGTYAIDPTHSRIGFAARHAMVTKVRGSFNQFEGAGFFDAETPANSRLEVTIQSASIDTRNADRDAHLRSNDFFDMESYPTIRFSSTEVASGGSVHGESTFLRALLRPSQFQAFLPCAAAHGLGACKLGGSCRSPHAAQPVPRCAP